MSKKQKDKKLEKDQNRMLTRSQTIKKNIPVVKEKNKKISEKKRQSNQQKMKEQEILIQQLNSQLIKDQANFSSDFGDNQVVLQAIELLASELIGREDDEGLNLEILVPLLINCLNKDENPDIMLLASTCINQLLDLQQQTILIIQKHDGIKILCSKMKNIEYQELQINCIKCLEIMSQKYSDSFYNQNFLSNLIDIYDFFLLTIQKSIINIFQNIVKNVQNELFLKDEIIPVLKKLKKINLNQTQGEDLLILLYAKISDKVIKICVGNYEKKQQYFKDIFDQDIIYDIFQTINQALNNSNIVQNVNILNNGIKIFSQLSYYNMFQCKLAFDYGMIQIIEKIIVKAQEINSLKDFSQILSDIVLLINQITNLRDSPPKIIQKLAEQAGIKYLEFTNANEKIKMLNDNKNYLQQTLEMSFTFLPDIFNDVSQKITKYIVLFIFQKLINFANAQDLEQFFNDQKILKFFTKLSASNDLLIITNFLLMIQTLFQKMPKMIKREGLLNKIQIIAENKIYLDTLNLNPISNSRSLNIDISGKEINILSQKLKKQKEKKNDNNEQDLQEIKIELKKLAQDILAIIPKEYFKNSISKQLQQLSYQFLNCKNSGYKVLQKLQDFIQQNGYLTYYEISQHDFFQNFNIFMTTYSNQRIHNFFEIFSQQELQFFINNIQTILRFDQQISELYDVQIDESLIQELKIVCNRSKFQIKYLQKNINKTNDKQYELYMQKDKQFQQENTLMMNLENHGTLEVVEDYLLNNQQSGIKLIQNQSQLIDELQNMEGLQFKFSSNDLKYLEQQVSEDDQELDYQAITIKRKISEEVVKTKKKQEIKNHLKINFYLNQKLLDINQNIYELMILSNNQLQIEYELDYTQPQIEVKNNSEFYYDNSDKELQLIKDKLQNQDDILNPQLVSILDTLNIIYYGHQLKYHDKQIDFESKKLSQLFQRLFQRPLFILKSSKNRVHKRIIQLAPFFFNTQSKITYFKSNQFSMNRIISQIVNDNKQKLQDYLDQEFLRNTILPRKKFNIPRKKVLQSSINNQDYFTSKNSIIEFDFYNEEGSGQGPTLEYYSLIVQEIQNETQKLWRKTSDYSFFPEIQKSNKHDKIFELMGVLVARAILDGRIIQLNLNPIFWKNVMKKPIFYKDLFYVDHELAKQFQNLQGQNVEQMHLNFVLPGSSYELIEGGQCLSVNNTNFNQFMQLTYQHYLINSIKNQAESFLKGFNKILKINYISQIFNEYEINNIFCGCLQNKQWQLQDLIENIIPSYGYTEKSQAFLNFLQIMTELDENERRLFLKFVTGCPTLPFGGFKDLNPKITIVKKSCYNQNTQVDQILPSVMTCQNYIKLPEYSCYEILRKQILFAIQEGQNNFSLS